MPYLQTAQLWLTQSTLLLQARPSTTRITTKYTILPPPDPSAPPKKPRKAKAEPTSTEDDAKAKDATPATAPATTQAPDPVRATLTLKTYDPVSGTSLKYSTTKAAEVSRLIQILGRLARPMAGLEEIKEDVVIAEADASAAPAGDAAKTDGAQGQGQAGGGAPSGGSKKKRGRGKK